jgi:hypothetical protein
MGAGADEGGAWPAALCRPGGGGLAGHGPLSQHKAQQAALVNEALTSKGDD